MFIEKKFVPFQECIAACFPDLAKRGDQVMYTVAFCIARGLPLPSAPVEDPGIYFNNTAGLPVMEAISQINEVVVFNVREAREMVRAFWLVRYNTVHPKVIDPFYPSYDFFCGAAHVGEFINDQQYKFLADSRLEIYRAASTLHDCLKAE